MTLRRLSIASSPRSPTMLTRISSRVRSQKSGVNSTSGSPNSNDAIAIDRNLAPAYAEKGHYMITQGRSPEAFDLVAQALRLDPHDPGRNIWEWYICNAHAHLAQWEQAVEWCQKSAATNPEFFWPHFELASAYAWLGRPDDAAREVRELHKLMPDATVKLYRALQDFPDQKFRDERDRIIEGLHKAGLPER